MCIFICHIFEYSLIILQYFDNMDDTYDVIILPKFLEFSVLNFYF